MLNKNRDSLSKMVQLALVSSNNSNYTESSKGRSSESLTNQIAGFAHLHKQNGVLVANFFSRRPGCMA